MITYFYSSQIRYIHFEIVLITPSRLSNPQSTMSKHIKIGVSSSNIPIIVSSVTELICEVSLL